MKNTIKKNKEGYGYKYVELAEINKYCIDNDITYYQEVETSEINQKDYIITYLKQNGEVTKHRGCQIVQAVLSGIKNPVQEYGSSLTYCRRYSLLMALGLATEDDDAQSLTEIIEMTKEEAENYTLSFGKHKGKKISELDEGYIEWLLNNSKDQSVLKAIEIVTGQVPLSEEELKNQTQKQVDRGTLLIEFQDLVDRTNTEITDLLNHYEVIEESELSISQLEDAIKIMKMKGSK